jgi:hypothetical protein
VHAGVIVDASFELPAAGLGSKAAEPAQRLEIRKTVATARRRARCGILVPFLSKY